MTDKVQKIREVIEKRYEYWKEKEFSSHSIESEIRMSECQHLLLILDSLQEEPVSEEFEKKFISFVNATHDNNGSYSLHDFAQRLYNIAKEELKEPVSEDFEEALANEWKGYIDRGAATVDALEDNTQELAFAKGFYRGTKWKEQKDSIISENLENVAKYYIPGESYHMIIESKEEGSGESVYDYVQMIDMFKAGVKWKEHQMMAKAIDGKVIANGMGNPILHLWDKGRHLIDKKVKVIVVKEE